MQSETRERLDDFWARRLGCTEPLAAGGVTVMAHAGLGDYRGVYLLQRAETVLLSVPPEFVALFREAVRGRVASEVAGETFLVRVLDAAAGLVIGPTWLGYADEAGFSPLESPTARALAAADRPELERLQGAVTPTEWERTGIDPAHLEGGPVVGGCFQGTRLAAAASYARLQDEVAELGLASHPQHRGVDHAHAAATVAARSALADGLLLGWQTPASNLPSLRIAEALGLELYAMSLAVRIELDAFR